MDALKETSSETESLATSSTRRPRVKRKYNRQYIAYLIHSFVGLKLTLIMTLVLASGTLAVLAKEIDWLMMPEMRVTPQAERLDPGLLLDKLQAAYPDHGLSFFQSHQIHPHTASMAMYNDDNGGFRYAWIDPYNGEVKGDTPLLTVGRFLSFLHGTLFLPVIGRSLVNAFGLLTLISLIAGLLAYPKFWRFFLKKPRTGNTRVFIADLHKLAGLWSIWFLLIIGISGSWWFYQTPFIRYLDAPNPVEPYPSKPLLSYETLEALGQNTPSTLTGEEISAAVHAVYPEMRVDMLNPPEHSADPYTVTGSFGEWLTDPLRSSKVYVNPYTGEIVQTDLVKDYTAMQRFDRAMDPLHYGNWSEGNSADLAVKITWFIFGTLMTGMAVTGLIINIKRTRRAARIVSARTPYLKALKKSWHTFKPWGGPMGVFKYANILMLLGVGIGCSIALSIGSQGVKGAGFSYSEKTIGPWQVSMNAYAGLLEKNLPPIRDGMRTNLSVDVPAEALPAIKFMHVRIGKPRTIRAPGTLIHGPLGAKHAHFQLPKKIRENARFWMTIQTWGGQIYQTSWPVMPDNKETFDAR
ncbi:PepSY-associated TM helix domain-containing protein [Oceanospirillum sediminis]|uniref:PepSY domain-containing protein n=1 Tax=Oceanospirillum sediminis TaxID=2760088 RepID=A0A839ITE3_9GAMM|nr:PepSY-associated TM helix domain-containing protein [Oceanospirillum sediminis]MBB1487950.1 PepSY domain-containing protein [Oceanospirillum sediminis]